MLRKFVAVCLFLFSLIACGNSFAQVTSLSQSLPKDVKVFQHGTALLNAPQIHYNSEIGYETKTLITDTEKSLEDFAYSYLSTVTTDLLGNIPVKDLKITYKANIPKSSSVNETYYVQLIQTVHDIDVEDTYVRIIIQRNSTLQEGYKVVLSEARLVKPKDLPSNVENIHWDYARLVAETKLNLKNQPVLNRKHVYRFNDEGKLALYQILEYGGPYRIYLDKNGLAGVEPTYHDAVDQKTFVVAPSQHNLGERRTFLPDPSLTGKIKGVGKDRGFFPPLQNLTDLELADLFVTATNGTKILTQYTDQNGNFIFKGLPSGQLDFTLNGKWAALLNPTLSFSGMFVGSNFSHLFNSLPNEAQTAEVNGYYHTTKIHNWIKQRLPTFSGIDFTLPVEVNINDGACNAWYDNSTQDIHFFSSGQMYQDNTLADCPNMAFDTVVYHEYTHFMDNKAGGRTEMNGWEDLIAAMIADTPVLTNIIWFRVLTTLFPFSNFCASEDGTHGLPFSSFGWALRDSFIQMYGPTLGKTKFENLVLPTFLLNSPNMPTNVFDILVMDDPDGNLSTGAPPPHAQLIIDAAQKVNFYPFPIQDFAQITNPSGDQLLSSGVISIQGKADSTSGPYGFSGYQLFIGQGPNPSQWFPFGPRVSTPSASMLGQLDASPFPAGTYTLKLEVYTNENLVKYQARSTFHLNNYFTKLIGGSSPKIFGQYISYKNDGFEVTLYDRISRTSKIISAPDYYPSSSSNISANLVVFDGVTFGPGAGFFSSVLDSDVFIHDIQKGQTIQINEPNSLQYAPNVDNLRVVWMDNRNGNWDIYYCDYNLSSGQCPAQQVTSNSADQVFPSVSGDLIVWEDRRNSSSDIYGYYVPTGATIQLTNDAGNEANPDIEGQFLVYEGDAHGNKDIFIKDILAPGLGAVNISNSPIDSYSPQISGNLIVWSDMTRAGIVSMNSNVYIFDKSTGQTIQLTKDLHSFREEFPSVNGRTVVWQSRMGVQPQPSLGGSIDTNMNIFEVNVP